MAAAAAAVARTTPAALLEAWSAQLAQLPAEEAAASLEQWGPAMTSPAELLSLSNRLRRTEGAAAVAEAVAAVAEAVAAEDERARAERVWRGAAATAAAAAEAQDASAEAQQQQQQQLGPSNGALETSFTAASSSYNAVNNNNKNNSGALVLAGAPTAFAAGADAATESAGVSSASVGASAEAGVAANLIRAVLVLWATARAGNSAAAELDTLRATSAAVADDRIMRTSSGGHGIGE